MCIRDRLQAVILSGKLPSELSDGIEIFPQVLKNARVKNENKGKFREDPEVEAAIAAAEKDLEGEGRVDVYKRQLWGLCRRSAWEDITG